MTAILDGGVGVSSVRQLSVHVLTKWIWLPYVGCFLKRVCSFGSYSCPPFTWILSLPVPRSGQRSAL